MNTDVNLTVEKGTWGYYMSLVGCMVTLVCFLVCAIAGTLAFVRWAL